jgi:Mg/Co/Ni transporter MgtE
VRFDDLLEEALNSLPDYKDPTILTQLPAKVIKALVKAMAYGPATVAACELLYSVVPPTVPVDQYLDIYRERELAKEVISLN